MVSNFELLMDFKNVRDFAICMSKNNICCHHKTYYNYECGNNDTEDACRRCWLDFLTGAEGLDLSYLDKEEPIESKTSPIKLSEKSMQILKREEEGRRMKSRYKLSDKVRKQRIRDWICLFLSITVFVLGFVWGMFDPSEPMEKGIICFAGIVLIEQFRCV